MPADILQTLLDREVTGVCLLTHCPCGWAERGLPPQVRISVSNLDLDVLGIMPGDTKETAMEKVCRDFSLFHPLTSWRVVLLRDMFEPSHLPTVFPSDHPTHSPLQVRQLVADTIAPKFDMDLDMIWGTDGKDMRLQVFLHASHPLFQNAHCEKTS